MWKTHSGLEEKWSELSSIPGKSDLFRPSKKVLAALSFQWELPRAGTRILLLQLCFDVINPLLSSQTPSHEIRVLMGSELRSDFASSCLLLNYLFFRHEATVWGCVFHHCLLAGAIFSVVSGSQQNSASHSFITQTRFVVRTVPQHSVLY